MRRKCLLVFLSFLLFLNEVAAFPPFYACRILRCYRINDVQSWFNLRQMMWPKCSRMQHCHEMLTTMARGRIFLSRAECQKDVGFLETTKTKKWVNGVYQPVINIEGLYTVDTHRTQGIASSLISALENWARQEGIVCIDSEVALDNLASLKLHDKLQYLHNEKVIRFRKIISGDFEKK